MPRSIRCIFPNLPHHAFHRGNNRQIVFQNDEDKDYFLGQLKKYAKDKLVEIGAYCLMTNHFHILLYPKNQEGLIKLMKGLCQSYTQYFNKKYKRTGKLWENRYKINIVEPEFEWVIAKYIEKNPLRAGIVKDAEIYRYSSVRANLKSEKDSIISRDIIGGQKEDYAEFFNEKEKNDEDQLKNIRIALQQEKSFGKKDFIKVLNKKFKVNFEIRKAGRPAKNNN